MNNMQNDLAKNPEIIGEIDFSGKPNIAELADFLLENQVEQKFIEPMITFIKDSQNPEPLLFDKPNGDHSEFLDILKIPLNINPVFDHNPNNE